MVGVKNVVCDSLKRALHKLRWCSFNETRTSILMNMSSSFMMERQPTIIAIPGPNTELKKLPPYSPFLNIVEQAISFLKEAIKADISRPEIQEQMNNREEARRQGIVLGNYPTTAASSAMKYWYRYSSYMWTVVSFHNFKHICHDASIVRQLRDKFCSGDCCHTMSVLGGT